MTLTDRPKVGAIYQPSIFWLAPSTNFHLKSCVIMLDQLELIMDRSNAMHCIWLVNKTHQEMHSRKIPDILISYNSYIEGVSCPTVQWNFLWLIQSYYRSIVSTLFVTILSNRPEKPSCDTPSVTIFTNRPKYIFIAYLYLLVPF